MLLIIMAIVYFLIFILFLIYDAVIGFGFEFDDENRSRPSVIFAALVWPISILIILIIVFDKWLNKTKTKRLKYVKIL